MNLIILKETQILFNKSLQEKYIDTHSTRYKKNAL